MILDRFQQNAMRAKERNTLVVAAPGSGKTTVIINRINHLIDKLNIDESSILVLTFTKAAAINMKNRYLKVFNKSRSPFFGTFHGLFYKILLAQNIKINIIESYITNRIIEQVLKEYFDEINDDKVKEIINEISLFNTSKETFEQYQPNVSKEIFTKCYQSYSKYKKENNLLDFDDLALNVLELFKNNPKIKEAYKKNYKYILVDEFQDCDELQIEFLRIMNEGGENSLFAVGDEDQCIYSFRGSKPEYMVTFNKIFIGGQKYYLSKNYRSKKNIIEASKKLIDFNKERNNKDIYWNREEDGVINYSVIYDERLEGEEIASVIKDIKNKNKSSCYKDNIVLYRTNIESMSIIDSFIRNDIPFTMLDKEYNFFNHFICKDLLAYLALAKDQKDRRAFLNIINKPFRYISKSNLAYIRDYKEDKSPFDILIEKSDTPPFQKNKLDELKSDFKYINKSSLSTAIQYIIMDLGYIEYLKSYSEKFNSSLEDLEDILEGFKSSAIGFSTIQQFFNHIEEVGKKLIESKRDLKEDRVILSTIHGVKGMEFKNVFIINCNEDTIPHFSGKEQNLEEERRLFYVGITRAIDNLYLFSTKTRKGSFKEPSRFLIEGGFTNIVNSSHGLNKGDEVHHRVYGNGSIKEINGDEVTISFDQGQDRKFSGKVLLENKLLILIK